MQPPRQPFRAELTSAFERWHHTRRTGALPSLWLSALSRPGSNQRRFRPEPFGFFLANHQLLRARVGKISKGSRASDAPAVRLQVGSRFRDPGSGEVSLELREGCEDVQHQCIHGHRPCVRCGHNVQFDIVILQFLKQCGEVPKCRRFRDSRSRRWMTTFSMPPDRMTRSNR